MKFLRGWFSLQNAVFERSLEHLELLTVVTEVEAVLNSMPLTYMSSEDVEEPLTPSHLILGYRVMSLPNHSNVTLDDPDFYESPDNLNRQFKHLATIMKKLWSQWRKEYLTDLRESHRTLLAKRKTSDVVKNGELVVVHDDNLSRGQWRLSRIEEVIKGSDRQVRGARVRMQTKTRRSTVLVQLLYPLKINCQPSQDDVSATTTADSLMDHATDNNANRETRSCPQRAATVRARKNVATWMAN